GYKDVGTDEFWVRGHMPDYPLLPGVLICEAAAQLCSYYIVTTCLCEGELIGFGGLENVRFRSRVRPGARLLLVGKAVHIKRRDTFDDGCVTSACPEFAVLRTPLWQRTSSTGWRPTHGRLIDTAVSVLVTQSEEERAMALRHQAVLLVLLTALSLAAVAATEN